MNQPNFLPNQESQFGLGDRVWYVFSPNQVRESRIEVELITIHFVGQGKDPIWKLTGYKLEDANVFSDDDWVFSPDELYSSETEAKEFAVWHPVTGISSKGWKIAIGSRKDEKSLDESELPRCCSLISNIRDILIKCKENKGLFERDVRTLEELFTNFPDHIGSSLLEIHTTKYLSKILIQLGVI